MSDRERSGQHPATQTDAGLEAMKQAATLQLLLKAARLADARALVRMRERTRAWSASGATLRAAHTALLPHLDFRGLRLTALAARLGVTKQAVGQLVDDLAAWGVVERVTDPTDGRAKLIRYAPAGRAWLRDGLSLLQELEREFAQGMGTDAMAALRTGLLALLSELEREGAVKS